jgi:hypothetical protein
VGLYQITVKFEITAKVGSVSNKFFWNINFASLAGNDLGRGPNQRHPLPILCFLRANILKTAHCGTKLLKTM